MLYHPVIRFTSDRLQQTRHYHCDSQIVATSAPDSQRSPKTHSPNLTLAGRVHGRAERAAVLAGEIPGVGERADHAVPGRGVAVIQNPDTPRLRGGGRTPDLGVQDQVSVEGTVWSVIAVVAGD